jgi:FkbM family methyltransferase
MIDEYPPVNGKPTYQYRKLAKALEYCKVYGVAVDIGAHCGLWSMHLLDYFERVVAFEPVEEYRSHFVRNVRGDYLLYPYALGEKEEKVALTHSEGLSGHTYVIPGDEVDVVTLDSYNLHDVSFIKVDCEGFEYFVLKGGENTILENKPVIIVEQKPQNKDRYGLDDLQAVSYLKSLGMTLKAVDCGDHIFTWD